MSDRIHDLFARLQSYHLRADERREIFDRLMQHVANHPVGSAAAFEPDLGSLADLPGMRGVADVSLYAYEKSLIFRNIAAFVRANPVRRGAKTALAPAHARPTVHLAVWQGTNIFRYVQPFYVKRPAPPPAVRA